jgi:2,3-bisphosphoglycerate-independent phosphoglycerate mutase
MEQALIDDLTVEHDTKIVFFVCDGLGGLAMEGKGGTEMQVAKTPHLDELARESVCGLLDPIQPGITPGSGPAHFALFGYDPVQYNIGRGILEAAGIDFPLTERDVVARINFATVNEEGIVVDRRAGRIGTEENERICDKLQRGVSLEGSVEVIVRPVKEHRAIVVLRADGLEGDLEDTDPQRVGLAPLPPKALNENSEVTVPLVEDFLSQTRQILRDELKANMVLLRGFAKHRRYPSMKERYKLDSLAIAIYPMYRGIAGLLGMTVLKTPSTKEEEIKALEENFARYDFFFIHIKDTDSRGEDGNFDGKVAALEEVDALLPRVKALNSDVLVVTGDHSTPSLLKSHSWHPVPVLLRSRSSRVDGVDRFDEVSCAAGGLGRMESVHLMSLALSHAQRVVKFGA